MLFYDAVTFEYAYLNLALLILGMALTVKDCQIAVVTDRLIP